MTCEVKRKLLSSVWLFVTPGLYSPWNSPGQNTGVGSLSFLQGIFPAQGSNPRLSLCRLILYQLRLKGIPRILEWVAYLFSRESSWFRNRTRVSCTAGGFFTNWDIRQWPRHCFILLKKKILIGVWLIHSTVLASGIQQSEPAPLHHKCIHIHAFFLRFFSRI